MREHTTGSLATIQEFEAANPYPTDTEIDKEPDLSPTLAEIRQEANIRYGRLEDPADAKRVLARLAKAASLADIVDTYKYMTRFKCQTIHDIAGDNRAEFFRALDRVGLTRETELRAILNPDMTDIDQEDAEKVRYRLENLKSIAQLISGS